MRKEKDSLRQLRNFLKLFPARAPPEFVAIDILGELIKTPRGSCYMLVISDRFSKLVRTVPLKKVTASEVAKAFIHHWVFPDGAPVWLLSDNGKQVIAKLIRETCRMLGVKNLYTTTYHPQTNGQVERLNRTILASLRHYVAEHAKDWDLFSDALTYAYNTQAHESTSVAPFELVLSRPPAPLAFEATPSIDPVSDEAQYQKKWTTYAKALTSTARNEIVNRQLRHKRGFDDRVMPYKEDVTVGTYVFLRKDYTNPRRESKHKLGPIATGAYKVTAREVNGVTIERENLEPEKVSRDRVVRAPIPMDFVIADSEQPEPGTPPAEIDVDATPDSISVNPAVGLADIPPPLTAGDSHPKGVHTRFIKYLRRARKTPSGTNTLEAEADSEPAHSQEATPPSRENPRVNDLTPGGPPPPTEVENVTHPSREVIKASQALVNASKT